MSRVVHRCCGLLAVLLIAGCASVQTKSVAEETETVEAEGWASLDPKDVTGTRLRALAEAQRRAVEKVAGVFLTASTKVDAAITVRQKIISDIKGYILRYEVIGEKTDAGFLKTRIRAIVLRRKPGDNQGMGSIPIEPPAGSPPVAVSILGRGAQAVAWEASAVSAVRGKLLARGFSVVEPDSAPKNMQLHIVIRGEALAFPLTDSRLGDFLSYRAKVKLAVFDPKTGAVISEQSREASALGINFESASSQAVENAGVLAGTAIADDLTAYLWKR